MTRTDLVYPQPRRVMLVDHAEQAQSVPGVEQAEIVEILDHHHIGSIETRSRAGDVRPGRLDRHAGIERFRQNGMEPSRSSAMMLLGAILSDTVILNSPTTTERDHAAIDTSSGAALDADGFGREMFEQPQTSRAPAEDDRLPRREGVRGGWRADDLHRPGRDGRQRLLERREELLDAMHAARELEGHALYALMVTDILAKGTRLLVSGNPSPVERAFEAEGRDGEIDLPGVMSRKKQVAPKLLAAF